ncbi:MAG TPA: hypothetical protein VK973_05080 [Arenicellales bacterium]|nr:hypothetical protein [Arenicellales bacterium]
MKRKQGSPGQIRHNQKTFDAAGGLRRRALRKLAAGSVVAGVAAAAPARWTRPVVESVMLPAHAQTSADVPEDGDFFMDLSGLLRPNGISQRQDEEPAPVWARLLDLIMPVAHAQTDGPSCLPCGACARIRSGKITLTVTGLSDGNQFCLEATGRLGGSAGFQLKSGDAGTCIEENRVEFLRIEGSAPARTLVVGGGPEVGLDEDPSRTCNCVEMACVR